MNEQQPYSDWHTAQEKLFAIKKDLDDLGDLSGALKAIRALMNRYPFEELPGKLEAIEADYRLMLDFFKNGYRDEKRQELYDALYRRLFRLLYDIHTELRRLYDSSWSSYQSYRNAIAFDAESVKLKLENFVTDVAMLSLEAGDAKQSALRNTYAEHHQYMQHLFAAMIFSRQWSHDFATDMAALVSSPTIETADAQLLVAGMMLGGMVNKDYERVLALVEIYVQAQDVHVCQRALVGWTIALNDEMVKVFPTVKQRIGQLLDDERVRREVMELQMQMVYCLNAKADNDRLQRDIMPSLLRNQNFEITSSGIKPKDEDPLEDILHPDADEKKMEELEQSMRKMMDMRDQGVDIYFSGFSQMKRFSFFYTLCNWFMPFSADHPQLQHLPADFLQSGMIRAILKSGSFCDSDKYSFVLGTSAIFNKLPANVIEMFNSGDAPVGIYGDQDIDVSDPQFVRRMYLQDLYRFFTLSDMRQMFQSPFEEDTFLFLLNAVFEKKMGQEARRVMKFLIKKKMYRPLSKLYYAYKELDNPNDLRIEARLFMRQDRLMEAQAIYGQLCDMDPEDRQALAGYAYASFLMHEFEDAADAYGELYDKDPDNEEITQNLAISLINSDNAEEGVKMLYRLEYEKPDDLKVKRALAWGQLFLGRTEQALALYQPILSSPSAKPSDYLNAAYCHWFSGKVSESLALFKESFLKYESDKRKASDIYFILIQDQKLFRRYGIGEVDVRLLAELIEEELASEADH